MTEDKRTTLIEVVENNQGRQLTNRSLPNPTTGDTRVRIWWTRQLACAETTRMNAYKELMLARGALGKAFIDHDRVIDQLNDIDTILEGDRAGREAEKIQKQNALRHAETAAINAEYEGEVARRRLEKLKRGEQDDIEQENEQERRAIAKQHLVSDVEIAELSARLKKITGENGERKIHPDAKKFQMELQRQDDMLATLKQKIEELISARGGVDNLTPEDQEKIREWEDLARTLLRVG